MDPAAVLAIPPVSYVVLLSDEECTEYSDGDGIAADARHPAVVVGDDAAVGAAAVPDGALQEGAEPAGGSLPPALRADSDESPQPGWTPAGPDEAPPPPALPPADPYAALPNWVPRTNVAPPRVPAGPGPIKLTAWERNGTGPPPPPPPTGGDPTKLRDGENGDTDSCADRGAYNGNDAPGDHSGRYDDFHDDDGGIMAMHEGPGVAPPPYPSEHRIEARGRLDDEDARAVMAYLLTGRQAPPAESDGETEAPGETDAATLHGGGDRDCVGRVPALEGLGERSRSTATTFAVAPTAANRSRNQRGTAAAAEHPSVMPRLSHAALEANAEAMADAERRAQVAARRRAALRAAGPAATRTMLNSDAARRVGEL